MRKDFRVRIFQPVVQEYRVALHDGLARRYGDRIEIWSAQKRGSDQSAPLLTMKHDYSHSWVKIGPLWWQKGLNLKGLSRGDVVVVCGDIHQLSSLWIAFRAKLLDIKVVWWGHHVSALARNINVLIRLFIARKLSDIMLCYTDQGIKYLESRGFKKGQVFATGNTIDIDAVDKAIKNWDGIRKFGIKKTLVFCGVLREKARVDVLLRALLLLRQKRSDICCVIIGNGDLSSKWQALAKTIGVSDMLTWTGEIRDQSELAPWFLSADLFVYPGRIGLSLFHAFSYGKPVILNDNKANHGPEYVEFRPGDNGWSFSENDERSLADVIEEALASSELSVRGARGREVIINRYTMHRMIDRFSEAIEAAGALA